MGGDIFGQENFATEVFDQSREDDVHKFVQKIMLSSAKSHNFWLPQCLLYLNQVEAMYLAPRIVFPSKPAMDQPPPASSWTTST